MNFIKTLIFITFNFFVFINNKIINEDDFSLKAIFHSDSNNKRISIINIFSEKIK